MLYLIFTMCIHCSLKDSKVVGVIPITLNPVIEIDSIVLLDQLTMSVIRWRSLSLENQSFRSLRLDR